MTDPDDELAQYAADQELNLYKEYRDVIGLFRYLVETDRRIYLANSVDLITHQEDGAPYFELYLDDAWVWDVFRTSRFIQRARVLTFRDVNIEELPNWEDPDMPVDGPHVPPLTE
ncbi:MAG TPA: DUF2469 domain-containing protein [Candidatus Yaniella excrementigallinarum]|nr:DUF2469 domain-containing protein [Candidatus Yaniella excrementigallinarum]